MEINKLNSYSKNPRKITEPMFDLLSESLAEYGDLSGIVFNRKNNQLVSGHQRTQHFKRNSAEVVLTDIFEKPNAQGTTALGYIISNGEKYAYREVVWDEKKHELAVVRANKIHGDFDWDILANQFEMSDLLNAGFTEDEFSNEAKEILEQKWHVGDIISFGDHEVTIGALLSADDAKNIFTGLQLDVKLVQTIVRRWETLTGKKVVKIESEN